MKQKYHIFSETMDVYDYHYSYEEMKVMAVIQESNCQLNYEDMCRIASAIYWHWADGRDSSEDEKYKEYPWLEIQGRDEYGYIQEYAERVVPYFIELYFDFIKDVEEEQDVCLSREKLLFYGTNVKISNEPRWERLATYKVEDKEKAFELFNKLQEKEIEDNLFSEIEIEEIYEKDNGDYEYKVIATTETKGD